MQADLGPRDSEDPVVVKKKHFFNVTAIPLGFRGKKKKPILFY